MTGNQKMSKRLLSFVLAVAMALSCVPTGAFASETEPEAIEILEQEVTETTQPAVTETTAATVPETTAPAVPEAAETAPAAEIVDQDTASQEAANDIASGTCGTNLTWVLDDGGTLTISGTGDMTKFDYYDDVPWYSHRGKITSAVLEEGVTSAGDYAFYKCTNLTNVDFPDTLKTIGFSAFEACGKLSSITLPENLWSIDSYAFQDCTGLTSFTIPSGLCGLGNYVFGYGGNIQNIYVSENNPYFSSYDGILYDKEKTTLVLFPLGRSGEFTIPDGVTGIESKAFSHCKNLTGIILPEGISSVSDYAFEYCDNLTSVTLADGIRSIGDYAFSSCGSLSSISLPDSVTEIGSNVFSNCYSLTSAKLPSGITGISDSMFASTGLLSYEIPDTVTSIGLSAFDGCYNLTELIIPDSVTTFGEQAFRGTGLTDITIPPKVQNIPTAAFSDCYNLTTVTIPDNITSISSYAFSNCQNLTEIVIPDSVTYLADSVFYSCSNLTNIMLPNSITAIDWRTFSECTSLGSITIPSSVTLIYDYAFSGCRSLAEITIPGAVDTIGECAFEYCDALKEATFQGKPSEIHEAAFSGVEATCYYYTSDNWTEEELQDYGGNLTWVALDGAEDYSANYAGKVISILGDSISTFAGYIPTADGFNLEHYARYPQDNLFTEVEHTWWMQVLTTLDAKLGINESWRSTEVYNYIDEEVNSSYDGTKACMASTTRIQNLGSNGTPDVILFYGGTNDITQRRTVGNFDPATAPTEVDLAAVKWDTVAEAYVAAIMRMQYYYPDAEIIAMLPTFTYKNTDAVIEEYNSVFAAICTHYGVSYIDLRECGITTANLPDGTHPDATGMDYITDAVLETLLASCEMEAGEHVVYSVTHELDNASASLSYYKGISAGTAFEETITGDNLTVTVTMGGADITDSVYAEGVVKIPSVTGAVIIRAEGTSRPVYEDHLQELPEAVCAGTNLWTVLEHDPQYYTASGWGTHSSGVVRSVTVPIQPGDRIWATSFQASGINGGNGNGIRLTWFDETSALKSMSPSETYAEFSANGYLTAPENAAAVNVVMWNSEESNEFYILNREHSYENGTCTLCGTAAPSLEGKTLSILGDSISTYTGVSNDASVNATLSGGSVYYTAGKLGVTRADTWWQQTIDALDLELLVNNSWSGSAVLNTRSGTPGAYVGRSVQLHNDSTGEEPDIIAVFLGTNDFSYYQSTLGTADIDYDALIADNGDGSFTYAEPATTCEAYAIMLHKMKARYPDADIYCMTLTARRDPDKADNYADVGQPTAFNAELARVIEHFGCTVVDLENCGIDKDAEIFDQYMGDQRVHPNAAGMDKLTQALIDTLLGRENASFAVTQNLTNVNADTSGSIVLSGEAYTTTLTAAAGFENLTVTVTMGGTDVTESCYADGKITIDSVTGDVVITASAAIDDTPNDYRWEFDGRELACTEGENDLTKLAGTVTDGVITNAYYRLEVPVILRHDQPWQVEFQASGSWSGMLFSAKESASTTGNTFLFKTTSTSGLIAFGERANSQYENYGVPLTDLGVDTTAEHVYRIENRISDDGTNMAYLLVDGEEYGPMNQHFIGGTSDQETTSDWLSGRDFCFSYLGAKGHTINNCALEYIQVWEGGIPEVTWESGTIASASGENNGNTTRLRTVDYLRLSDFGGVGISHGYTMTNFVYDENKVYLGTSSWLGSGISFTTAELQEKYPTGVYFRIALRTLDSTALTVEDVSASGVTFYMPGQEIPVPESEIKPETVMSIGAWQDGAIYDGKLFVLGGSGSGAVYDLAAAAKLGTFTLDSTDILKPHANSVCFGSTFYAEGDKYPLLYVNIYNNYASAEDRMEGTCCVYRVVETDGSFSTELVQVIRIGFTEDLTLWKSKENNGDVRPYGNFVVDTDNGKLYAFVMRDAGKTTRFFRFDLPAMTDGEYSETYGCNLVTLESSGIETRFDTEYFNYLQGCCYYNGKIISVEGFNSGGSAEPALRIVDLTEQTVAKTCYPAEAGLTKEPEVVCVDPADGTLYYAAADGVLRKLSIEGVDLETGAPEEIPVPLSLGYDDHYSISGKTVEIIDPGTPTSYQVGYGVAEGTLDTAVVTIEGDNLVATGIGTAKVKIDGTLYEVTVTAAPISLILLAGQSNMQGSEGNADQSIICPEGQVYSTYGDRYTMTVSNATNFAPSALTGEGSTLNVNGTTTNLEDWPVYLLNEAGAGKAGPDSGYGYEWVLQTGEKVWIVNAAHGGTSINAWQDGGAQYEECVLLFKACQETLRKEIAAGHFTLSHMGYFWCQGCTDETQTAAWYVDKYLTLHESFKTELAFDEDTAFEFGGIIPIRSGHQGAGSYRAGVYTDTTTAPYFESFKDLRFNGPRVAQYWMGNNPDLPDIWNVCTIQEDWVTMPDGTDGVAEYFQAHYENGTVDYEPQVAQKASWYTPATPAAVHDSIHYNQIGYNEIGREAVRNALINLGKIEAPETEATVEFIGWDGFTPVETVTASTAGSSGTLVVPMVSPVYKSKDVTYQVSDGLVYDYYDLLAEDLQNTGTLTAAGAQDSTVTVNRREFHNFRWDLENGILVSTGETENTATRLAGSTEDGVFIDTRYQLTQPIILSHDQNWCLEWKMTGPWYDDASAASKKLLCEDGASTTVGAIALLISGSKNRISIGYYGGQTHLSYGVCLDAYGISIADTHTYRLVNHINEDGSNTIYLFIDGEQIAPMTRYITGSDGDMGVDSDYLSGKDLSFGYMGVPSYPLDNGSIDYMVVQETGYAADIHFHDWSDWETVTEPTADAPGSEQRTCACGEVEIREVEGSWQKYALADHMAPMPEDICSGTNLWAEMEHDEYYFASGSNWAIHSSGTVYSITIPVTEGDQIYASSFGKAGENGHGSTSGIRTTFFDAYGVAKSMSPADVYAEFSKNGCLTAPEGSVAINIAMWSNADDWEVYILNREHSYESAVTEPTCTEQGYTTYTCECGESYVDDYVDATGHSFGDWTVIDSDTRQGTCSSCGDVEQLCRMTLPAYYTGPVYVENPASPVYVGTSNVADILGLKNGTFSQNGVTVTVEETKITVSGTPSQNLYFDLQMGTFGVPDYTRDVGYSLPDGNYRFGISGNGSLAPTVCIRYPDGSTNLMAVSHAVGILSKANISGADFGVPYLYFPAGKDYDFSGNLVLNPSGNSIYDNQDSEIVRAEETGAYNAEGFVWSADANAAVFGCQQSQISKESRLIYSPGSKEYIRIYLPQEEGYLQVRMNLANSSSTNAYGWRLDMMYACDDSLAEMFPVTNSGEYEAAIKLKGRPDFMGMGAHGSERMTSFAIFVDGTEMALDQLKNLTLWDTVKIVRYSDFYDPNDETTVVAHHTVEYDFDQTGITVTQNVEWLVDETCAISYMMMFPVRRAYENLQITDTYFDDYDSAKYDVSQEGFTTYPAKWTAGATKLTLSSEKSGVTASMESLSSSSLTGTGYKQCSPNSSYNKLYLTICGGGNTEHAVKVGDVWNTQTRYEVTIGKGTEVDSSCIKGHSVMTDAAVTPTCTEPGLTEGRHCSVCETVLAAQEEIPALGHTWDEGIVTKESTEETEGERTYTCKTCAETRTEVIPTLDHVHSYEAVVTAPTCTEQGYTTHTCRCGDSYVDSYTDATGHSYGEWDEITAPTCTEKGEERRDCGNCDHFETREIAATGHTEVIDEAVAATCTEPGLTEGKHCSVCETVLAAQEEIPALGHDWDEGIVTKEPTEETEGERTYTCERCGDTKTESIPTLEHVHNYEAVVTAPTCTEQGYTTHTCRCGDSYVDSYTDATGHSYGEWDEITAPTCTEKGEERRDCGNCDHYETREVAATGHSYEAVVTAPTCTGRGYTTHTCHCGDTYVDSYVDSTGHSFGDWTVTTAPTCTEKGEERRDCGNCDHYETREVAATGHSCEAVVTAPTCTGRGYTTHTCHCGDSFVDAYTDALGHDYGAWYVVKEATPEEEGQERRDCGRCDEFQTRKIPTLEHQYTSVVTAPTCTEQGYTTHTCAVCGDTYTDTYVDALSHSFVTYTPNGDATCTEDGTKTAKCERCDATDTLRDAGSATGHSFGEWAVTTGPTCTEKGTERRDCENCDHYEIREVAAAGHSYEAVVTAPTCTGRGYTAHTCHCGDTYVDSYVDSTGHSFGDWTVTTAPTCTETGTERRDCENCDHFESRNIAAAGHTEVIDEAVEATCTESGLTEGRHCSLCDTVLTAQEEIPALGHTWDDGVVTKEPTEETEGERTYTCKACGETKTEPIPALDHVHDYESVVTAPTCTEQGYTTHTCACGDSFVDSYAEALGHSLGAWTVILEPTYTEPGQERQDCENCDHFETREIPRRSALTIRPENGLTYLPAGRSLQLTALRMPENTPETVTWQVTSGADAASVNAEGLLTAASAADTTVITVSAVSSLGASAEISLTVLPAGAALTLMSGNEVLETTLDVDMKDVPTLALHAKIADLDAPVLTWRSGSSAVASVENGTVTFLKPGTVTVTAADPYGLTASVTLTVRYLDAAAKLTASAQVPAIGLQPGEVTRMLVSGLDAIGPQHLTFRSSDEEMARVSEDGTITAGEKTGTATITASLTGDPLNRKAEVKVKVIPPQTAILILRPEENIPGALYRMWDLNSEETAAEAEASQYTLYLDKNSAQNTTFTITAEAMDGQENPIALTSRSLKWASSDTRIATVKANADGSVTVTVKKNAIGACAITAVSTDLAKKEAELNLHLRDYAPRLESKRLTLNSWLSSGVSVGLVESYENAIARDSQGRAQISLLEYNSRTKAYEPTQALRAAYADQTLTITHTQALTGSRKLRLEALCMNGSVYSYDLTLTVRNAFPAVTVKQSGKFNLFYRDSRAELTVTARDTAVTDVSLRDCDFVLTKQEDTYVLTYADPAKAPAKPDTKGTLVITLAGYTVPVEKAFTLSAVTAKPSLTASPASSTVYPQFESAPYQVRFVIWDKTAGAAVTGCEGTVTADFASGSVTAGTALLTLAADRGGTATAELTHPNWTQSVKVTHKVTVQSKLPTAKLESSTLTLNNVFTARTASTYAYLDQSGLTWDSLPDFVSADKGAENLQVSVDPRTGVITAAIREGRTVKAGTYTFRTVPTLGSNALNTLTLKIRVVSDAPKLKLSASTVRLNTALAGQEEAVLTAALTGGEGYELQDFQLTRDNVRLYCQNGSLAVTLLGEAKKSTAFALTPQVKDLATGQIVTLPASAALTVQTYSSEKLSITLRASGSIDLMDSTSAIAYSVSRIANASAPAQFLGLTGADAEKFRAAEADGRILVSAKPGQTYATNASYKVQLVFSVCSRQVTTAAQTIRVKQSSLKITPAVKKLTYYQSQSTSLTAKLNLTAPAFATLEGARVTLNRVRTPKALIQALGSREPVFRISDDGRSIVLTMRVRNEGRLVSGKTYNLILDVTPAGWASNAKPIQVKIPVTVSK